MVTRTYKHIYNLSIYKKNKKKKTNVKGKKEKIKEKKVK